MIALLFAATVVPLTCYGDGKRIYVCWASDLQQMAKAPVIIPWTPERPNKPAEPEPPVEQSYCVEEGWPNGVCTD
jgi:hypothetical protein